MIDVSKITYHVTAVTEKGDYMDIQDFVTNLGWEENEKEISARACLKTKIVSAI